MKIALCIEYNGAKFRGWQSQPNLITLQSTLESALSKVAAETVNVICAGRTDAGVHATHQVVHFETNSQRNLNAWIYGTNSYLPSTIAVIWAKEVDDTFHARFSALSRRYQYFIYNHPVRSSLFNSLTTWMHQALDEKKMHVAGQHLLGEHDFSSFRSADCQSKTAKRHVFALNIKRFNDFIIIDIVANSFLHHMVRNIAGVLMEIGTNKKEVDWVLELLQVKNRKLAARTAPSSGLYLGGVQYADQYDLPSTFRSPSLFEYDKQ